MKTYELAVETAHGAWEHCGTYGGFDAAVAAAKEFAPNVYQSDNGLAVFGISDDPNSGHYEHRLEIDTESGCCVHLDGGAIVGTI